MRFEYILLLILSILPLIYKIGYWQKVFLEQKKGDIDVGKYLLSKQGRASCTHFWTLLEFLIMMAGILPLLDASFEYLWYPMFFYFLIIYNIYVLGKIFRKKMYYPRINYIFTGINVLILSILSLSFIYPQSIYILISAMLLGVPITLLVTQKLVSFVGIKK